ncbi:phage tail tape measure protein [Corynebacterium striatum]
MARDAQYVPILPSFDGFFKSVEKGAQKGGEQAGKSFADSMQRQVKKAEGAVEKATIQVERSRKRQADSADKTRVMEAKLAEVMDKGNATASQKEKAIADLNKARRDQAANDKAVERANRKLETAQQDLTAKTQEADDALSELDSTQDRVAGSSVGLSDGLKVAAGAFAALSGSAIVVGKTLTDIGGRIDEAWDTIRVGTGASGEALEGLKDSARAVAESVPSSFEDVGTAVADVNTRLGLTGKPLERFSSQLLELENMGVDADINSVSQALSGFGVEAENAPDALDKLFQVSQATGLSVTELSNSAVKAGPALRGFGFSLEDSAAMVGQMDKAGLDADKTLQSMQRALSEFAKEGRNAPEALQETIGSVEDFIAAGDDAAAIDLASGIFGTRGAAQFVDAVKSGTLSVEDFMGATGATSDTILGVAEETRSMGEEWQIFKNKAMTAIEPIALALFDRLGPALEAGSEKFQELIGWIEDDAIPGIESFVSWLGRTSGAIAAIATPVGILVGAYALLAAQQKIMVAGGFLKWLSSLSAITKIQTAYTTAATAAQTAFNLVMNANPIFLIVTALTALVAGLAVFFTKTETGKQVWQSLVDAMTTGWNWIRDNVITPFTEGVDNLGARFSEAMAAISEWWNDLTANLQAGWQTVRDLVFSAFTSYIARVQANWETVTSAISTAWDWVTQGLYAGWVWLRDGLFAAFLGIIESLRATWDFFTNAITGGWNWLTGALYQGWVWVRDAVLWAWNREVEGLRILFDIVTGAISNAWNWVTGKLAGGWNFINDVVFGGLRGGLNVVRDSFSWAVDKIGAAWDRIRELTKKPVQFVVNTVYNNGIRKAWNAVSKIVGLDELPEYTFATGGILPGYTPGRDPYTFIEPRTGMSIGLSGGEAVIRPEATRVLGTGWVDGVNAAARMGGAKGVKKFLGGYAGGGVIDSITNIVAEKFPMMTITSTWRNTNDYHGQGKAVDFSNGTDDTPQMQDAAAYFAENYGKALLELIHSPFGTNIKNGQSVGDGFGFYGAGTMAEHRNHVHVAADSPLEGGGMGGVLGIAAKAGALAMNAVKSMWDKAISPIKGAIPQFPGIIGGLPGAVLDKLSTAAWDFVMSKLPGRSADGAYHGAVGGGVEQWRGMVVSVLKSKGFSEDLADTVLRRMNQESGGNPGSVNDWDSNAAAGTPSKGLMQVIDPTFQAYKDPGYDDIWDPEANLRASMNYAVARYGSLPAAYNQAGGYASGGIIPEFTGLYDSGGWLPHMGAALNLSGKPEPVLTDGHWEIVAGLIRKVGELIPPLHDVATNIADNLAPAMREMAAAWSGVTDGDRTHLSRLIGEDNARSVAWSAAWAGTASQKELFDTFSKLPKIGEYTSAFSGIIDGQDAIAKKYAEHGEALKVISEKEEALAEARKALSEAEGESVEMDKDQKRKLEDAEADLAKAREDGDAEKIAEKEKKLAEVREDIDDKSKQSEEKKAEAVKAAQEKVLSAEMDLSDARSAAADVAKAAGHAQIALAIEIANTIFDILEKLVSTFMKAKVDIAAGVTSMMGSIKDLTDLIEKQRETVIGLALDFVGAQIDVMDAARKSRFTQISGAQATLEASRSLAEAQAAFDNQRMADMNAALSLHQDLTLATDRWRWNLRKQVDGAVMDMSQWSDETRALYAELQAAQANLQLKQLEAQKANLKAAYDQTLAVLDLSDVTRNLQVASKQLALMSGEAFGFNQIGATVGERYASLAEELASIEAKKADFGTWANPANWFNGYYKNANRRQDEIRKEMAELAARPDFQGIGISEKDISKMVAGAGFMGLFGGSGDVKDYIANSKLGDPARALDRVKWESDLVELEASQKELRSKVERGRAELDYKSELGPLEERIKATELERESQKNWAEYWRATNDEVKSAIANIATYQEDTAAQLRAIAERPVSLTLQIPSGKEALSVRELEAIEEQLRKQNAGIELRLDRIENPRPGGADISRKVRG